MKTDELVSGAANAFAAGRLDEAQRLAQAALNTDPDQTEALLVLGMVAERQRNPDVAAPLFLRVAELDPACYQSRLMLSIVLRSQGHLDEALDWAIQAVALDNSEPRGQNQLGLCHLSLQHWKDAALCFSRALQFAPNVAVIHGNLGQAFQGAGMNPEAIRSYTQALNIDPRQINIIGRLATVFIGDLNHSAAAECARKMLEIDSLSASGNILLATALMAEGHAAEAIKHARRAAKVAPADSEIIARYGTILQMAGQMDEAGEQFKKAIDLNPRQAQAFGGFARNRKVTEEDRPLVNQMEDLVLDPSFTDHQISELEYALGKAYQDLGEHESAMTHFDAANGVLAKAKAIGMPFDRARLEEAYGFAIRTYDSEFVERYKNAGSDDPLPIFVVGMMRSGTTLAEQILSSHRAIGGAGELLFWDENARKAFDDSGIALNAGRLKGLCDEYRKILRTLSPGAQRVVDKLVNNFLSLGLLHCAFPNARMIHMRRSPVDTCLSIWTTPNRTPADWANEKANIVFAYKLHLRLEEHWLKVLPADRYLTVQYEELVSDQEQISRQMVDFCGLEWDDACLRPEDNTRSVITPSLWQVRQPVYKSSTERWRSYEPWLGEFADLLDLDTNG